MNKKLFAVFLVAAAFMLTAGSPREKSLTIEQKLLERHPVEQVANYRADVVYASPEGHDLTMDISWPEGEGPFPCLVIIHGGGWRSQSNKVMQGMARYITNRGYSVFNINYRMIPDVTMQEIVEDCLGAVIWVKEHSPEYNGDPERIAVTGDSAGGHLTAMIVTQGKSPEFTPTYIGTGTYDTSVNCAIPSYGVFEFMSLQARISFLPFRTSSRDVLGVTYRENPELYERFSPLLHVRPGIPPQLVICGTLDTLFFHSQAYVRELKAKGSPVEFHVVNLQPHAFLSFYWTKAAARGYDRIIRFLDEQLK